MTDVNQLITEHLDIWTSSTEKKSSAGRGSGGAISLYGIKKLRELILELAIRGKLSEQNTAEGTAAELLKEISTLKSKHGKVSSRRKLHKESNEEEILSFEIPSEWGSAPLGDVCEIVRGITFSGKDKHTSPRSGLVACLRTTNVQDQIETDDLIYVDSGFVKNQSQYLRRDDIVISMANSRALVGKVALFQGEIDETPSFGGFLAVIRPFLVLPAFMMCFLRAPSTREEMIAGASQTTNIANISLAKLEPLQLPIPPLAEQHRIVVKVDELMGLCDTLERQAEDNLKAHQTLVETCLATLTNSQNAEDLTQNWTRIEAHFDTLFTTEESLDSLWKATLKIAVRGDLMPQEPSNEPASELISDIWKTKEAMIAEGKLRKAKALTPIKEEEIPFPLKEGWLWVKLNDFIDVRDGTHDSPKDAIGSDTFPLVTSKNFKDGTIDFETARRISAQDHKEISKRSHVERDDILFSMIGGNLGNQVIVKTDQEFSVKNVALFKYYDKAKSLPDFVKLYMENLAVDLQKQASGGAQPFVSLGFLRNLLIAVPPANEQQRIVQKARSIEKIISSAKTELSKSVLTSRGLADTLTSRIH